MKTTFNNIAIAVILRCGVIVAAAIGIVGGILYLSQHFAETASHSIFLSETTNLRTVTGIVATATTGNSLGIIQLGILVLIATPVMRVALSLFLFISQRDKIYVAITSIVLLLLLYSLVYP